MQNTNTLYSLQLLRFIASVLVMLLHLEIMKSGYKGVDIFFVISGFVMYYISFIRAPKAAINFIINRATKIYILYWLAMVLLFFIIPYNINESTLKSLLLIPGHVSLIGFSWSLSYEIYFYFLFGIIIYLLPSKYHKPVIIFLFMITSVITILNTTQLSVKGTFINFLLGQNFWEFLLGILSGLIYHKICNKLNLITPGIIVLISFSAIIIINIPDVNAYSCFVYGLLSFFIILFAAVSENKMAINKRLAGLVNILGDASYAIYLFAPIITAIVMPKNNSMKIMVIAVTIPVSIFINQFIENKLLKICRNLLLNKLNKSK